MTEHRYASWVDTLRELGGIPADAVLNIMRDYGVLTGDTRNHWTGGYIADWYAAGPIGAMELLEEQEVLVDNVAVKVRRWGVLYD